MKLLTCFLAPARLDALKRALWERGYRGVSVSQGEGLGLRARTEREDEFVAAFQPRVRVEVACKDAELDALLELVIDTARTGRVGDGKVFVTELVEVVRVRTGERGEAAL